MPLLSQTEISPSPAGQNDDADLGFFGSQRKRENLPLSRNEGPERGYDRMEVGRWSLPRTHKQKSGDESGRLSTQGSQPDLGF